MNELALFAKLWEPGRVKTRLAANYGELIASQLHRAFVATMVERLGSYGDRRSLYFSPADAAASFRQLPPVRSWQLVPQVEGDLGERLAAAIEQSLSRGAQRVVILGSDSPTVPLRLIDEAFDVLREKDVVLGPADDGGYYLLGLRRNLPEIFRGIPWGGPWVWQQTLERLTAMSSSPSIHILPGWYDIDRPEDLERLRDELAATAQRSAALERLARQIQRLTGP